MEQDFRKCGRCGAELFSRTEVYHKLCSKCLSSKEKDFKPYARRCEYCGRPLGDRQICECRVENSI